MFVPSLKQKKEISIDVIGLIKHELIRLAGKDEVDESQVINVALTLNSEIINQCLTSPNENLQICGLEFCKMLQKMLNDLADKLQRVN